MKEIVALTTAKADETQQTTTTPEAQVATVAVQKILACGSRALAHRCQATSQWKSVLERLQQQTPERKAVSLRIVDAVQPK